MRKRVETYDGSSWPETSDELFIYDGWNPVLVFNGNATDVNATAAITRKYTWGLDLSRTLHGAGGIGGLLAAVETKGTAGETDDEQYWFMYDANGNVGQVLNATDPNNLTLAAHYEYDPYGNVINNLSSYTYATANPFRFSTKWFDAETGLGYWGYRYYSPRLGRWISMDPIGEKGGLNLCAFVENGPPNWIDPLGTEIYDVMTSTVVHVEQYPVERTCAKKVSAYTAVRIRYDVHFTSDTLFRKPKRYFIRAEARAEVHWSCNKEWFLFIPYCDYVEGSRSAVSADVEDGGMSAGVKIGLAPLRQTRPHCREFKVGWVAWRNHGPVDASVVGGVDTIQVPILGTVSFPFKIDGVMGVASPGETTFTTCCEECNSGCCKATSDTAETGAQGWPQHNEE